MADTIMIGTVLSQIREHFLARQITRGLRAISDDRMTLVYLTFLIFILLLGAIGPEVAPYPASETLYFDDGSIKRGISPTLQHPLGTNNLGYDIFSRILVGARPTAITGLLGGSMIITIGVSIGLTAGYMGGRVDDALMRLTDLAYGVPFIPFAIVLVTFLNIGFLSSVLVIGLILWRGNARVIRSQVLQIKERPFILAARASGAGTPRIILKHVLPNVASMAILFFALGIGFSIVLQASLAFLGVSNPFVPSWGVMLRNAFNSGQIADMWWWSLPPGLLISLTVVSTFMFGRRYEAIVTEGEGGEAIVKGG